MRQHIRPTDNSSLYTSLGASADKKEVHEAIKSIPQSLYPGAFCRVLPDLFGKDPSKCVISHSDSAGTKCIVGYLAYRETGDPSLLSSLAVDATVMNLDDMCCAGARGPFVLSNTITRNYNLIGGDAIAAVIDGYMRFATLMQRFGVTIELAGGETEDLGDIVRTLTVGATMTAICDRTGIVDNSNITPGDVIVALASSGQATYEDRYNSGIASNGLTLARHRLISTCYLEKYPEICDPALSADKAYRGPFKLSDPVPNSPLTVGESLLSPTRTFAPVLLPMLDELGANIHGLVHCTGGGQVKCKGFGSHIKYVKTDLFPVPPIFELIRTSCEPIIPWREMYRVFNMGHRLEIFLQEKFANRAIEIATLFGVEAKIVGHCEQSHDGANIIELSTPEGVETY